MEKIETAARFTTRSAVEEQHEAHLRALPFALLESLCMDKATGRARPGISDTPEWREYMRRLGINGKPEAAPIETR